MVFEIFQSIISIDLFPMFTLGDNLKNIKWDIFTTKKKIVKIEEW